MFDLIVKCEIRFFCISHLFFIYMRKRIIVLPNFKCCFGYLKKSILKLSVAEGEFWFGGHLATKRLSRAARRTIAKFKILKRFKVLEKKSFFQKINIFSCLKNPFFYENFRKFKQILQKFLNFLKCYFQISSFMEGLEIHRNFRWILLASWEPSQKGLDRGGIFLKRSEIFGDIWLKFIEKCKIFKIYRVIAIRQQDLWKLHSNSARLDKKNTKVLDYFGQILYIK